MNKVIMHTLNYISLLFSVISSKSGKENVEESKNTGNAVFCQEGLSDGGLPSSVLRRFCSSDARLFHQFDSLKFSSNIYSWS